MKIFTTLPFALTTLVSPAMAQQETPAAICVAASHRIIEFMLDEAKGTRHEAQIAGQIDAIGKDGAAIETAKKMGKDECATIMGLSDSAVRAFVITMLPERQEN